MYALYNQTDENILHFLKLKNLKANLDQAVNLNGSMNVKNEPSDVSDSETTIDGTKLLLSQFIRYYGKDNGSQELLLDSLEKFKMVRTIL